MGLTDLILFPMYTLALYFLFGLTRRKTNDPLLKKYHGQGFWIKVFSAAAFTFFNVYISPGDSYGLYYVEGTNIAHLISSDLSNISWWFTPGTNFDQSLLANPLNAGYFMSESNYFICKLVSFFSFLSFSNYLLINLFFSLIAFSGSWRLFKFFYEQHPQLHKQFAIAILYLPTFVFWSSGILKDSVCIAMLGYVTYSIYNVLILKTGVIKYTVLAIISGYVIAVVKSYILISYLPFFMLYLLLNNVKLIRKTSTKMTLLLSFFIITIIGFVSFSGRLQEAMGGLAIDQLTETVKKQQDLFINISDAAESSFSLGVEFDGSNGSLVRMAPAAVAATLFRPYLWESKKLSTLLSSLESLALMLFTLYVFFKAGPLHFFLSVFKDPLVMFCFFFSIVFALFVGATTLNFGTLVRYKIPCMPFYIISMVLIREISKKRKTALSLKKAIPPIS